MVLYSAVQYFHHTFKPRLAGEGDHSTAIPNIISSKIEHPAVNEYLEHLERTRQAGKCLHGLSCSLVLSEELTRLVQNIRKGIWQVLYKINLLDAFHKHLLVER